MTDTALKKLLTRICFEVQLSYRFIHRDLSSTLCPASIFLLASLKHRTELPWHEQAGIVGNGLVYSWLYIYLFCLSNQITGVDEDRINKPDRPIASGLVTPRGAMWRWIIVMCSFTLLGWHLGVMAWAVLWQIATTLHNFFGWSRHWITKGIVMSVGVVAQLAAAWQIAGPLTPPAWSWILWVSVLVFPTVPLQDLRDLAGDRSIRRKTLPLAIGERNTRIALFMVYLCLPIIVHFGMMAGLDAGLRAVLCEAILAATCLVIAIRVVALRSPGQDHRTYLIYTGWYCLILASALYLL